MIPKLMRVDKVASLCGINKSFAYQMIRTGKLQAAQMGTAVRVRLEDLSAFIEENLISDDSPWNAEVRKPKKL